MVLIRMYDTNKYVLVVRKSDYENNNIGDGYFIVPNEEWTCEDDGIKKFHHTTPRLMGTEYTQDK